MKENIMQNYSKEQIKDSICTGFYEDPYDTGVFVRFEDAVKVLSTENGALNKRLYRAYYDCGVFHLGSNNFKDEFIRNNLHNIEIMADKGLLHITRIKLPPDYHIRPQQFYLHWKQTAKMANCIFQIYKYLVELRLSKEQKHG